MKNRLQFNRIPRLFENRELAKEFLRNYVNPEMRPDFIPLIGEPIVARYYDAEHKKQLILAIGKSVSGQVEYHVIDSAELQEGVNIATENASEALNLASAATKAVADYRIILENMIKYGVELEKGSYFDTDDPTGCGLYKVYPGTNFISAATSLAKADYILDQAIGNANENLAELSGATADAIDGLNGLSAATQDLSANTVAGLAAVNDRVSELSATTEAFSAATDELFDAIENAAGLEADGTYKHPHDKFPGEVKYINEASSLYEADVKLDKAVSELSANTISGINELSANTVAADNVLNEKINTLSANTVAALENLAGNTDDAIRELSANTVAADNVLNEKINALSAGTIAADQALQGEIDELANRDVLGKDAIKVNVENGDSTVSLLISDQDKALSQDVYGLKTNLNLVYSSADSKIYLMGKDNQEIAHIDTNDFIKDGMIDEVKIITPTRAWIDEHPEYAYANLEEGKPYLWITFNTDSEKSPKDVFLRLDSLVDTYTVDQDSRNFMEINDYVISLKVNEDGRLAGYDYAKGISAVTANIISATGLNIGEQGTYPGHDETHIIKNANSLDEADVLLDAAIYGVSGMVIDLSGNVINYVDEKTAGYDEKIDTLGDKVAELSGVTRDLSGATYVSINELSAATVNLSAVTENFSAATHAQIMELSARTFDPTEIYRRLDEEESARTEGDEYLQDEIDDIKEHLTGEYIPLDGYEIASGTDIDDLLVTSADTVNEGIGKLQKQILDNEEVVSAALNDLNNRITENDGKITELSGATEESIIELWDAINSASGATDGVLTLNLNGVEQGKYCPSADTTINLTAIQEVTGADVLLTGYEIASGHGEEDLTIVETDNVNEAFGKVQKQIIDNELVIAAAFNDINDRLNTVSGDVQDIENKVNLLENQVITGVSIDGVAQPVVDNVVNLQIEVPVVSNFFDGAEYNSTDKKIYFKHGNNVVNTIDATDFIKDGMLNNVEVVTVAGETYLRFTFNTDAGKEAIDIKVSDFAGLYTAGNGINISNDNVISAKLANKGDTEFLYLDGDGIYLSGVSAALDSLSGTIIENEYVVSAALNDLNDKIEELSGMTGETAKKLDHNVTLKIAGESYGSAVTDFSGAEVKLDTYKKFVTTANTTNLNLNEFLTIVSLGADSTVTFASTGLPVLPAGGVKEAHIIVENTGTTNIAVTVSSDARVKCTGGNIFNIPQGDMGELNALITYDGTNYTIYVITT